MRARLICWFSVTIPILLATACSDPPQDGATGITPIGSCVELALGPDRTVCLMSERPPLPEPDQLVLPDDPARSTARGPAPVARALPTAVDLRDDFLDGCLLIHDQGHCSWCTLHATTAALEAVECRVGGSTDRLSEPFLRWIGEERADFTATSCESGWSQVSAFLAARVSPIAPELLWPQAAASNDPAVNAAAMNASRPDRGQLDCARGVRPTEMRLVTTNDDARQALADGHTLLASLAVHKDTGWDPDAQGNYPMMGRISIPDPEPPGDCRCTCEASDGPACVACPSEPYCVLGFHTVLITGYDDADQSFQFLNSWGPTFGDGGYGRFSYDYRQRYAPAGISYSEVERAVGSACEDGGGDCPTIEDLTGSLLLTHCTAWHGCCSAGDLANIPGVGADVEECVASMRPIFSLRYAQIQAAVDAGEIDYSCRLAARCVDDFAALSCPDFAIVDSTAHNDLLAESCRAMFVPRRRAGEACSVDESCTTGLCGQGPSRVCVPLPQLGESCFGSALSRCDTDGYCELVGIGEAICMPRGPDGAPCTNDDECLNVCDAGTCAPVTRCDGM